jgi:hypothetical protein
LRTSGFQLSPTPRFVRWMSDLERGCLNRTVKSTRWPCPAIPSKRHRLVSRALPTLEGALGFIPSRPSPESRDSQWLCLQCGMTSTSCKSSRRPTTSSVVRACPAPVRARGRTAASMPDRGRCLRQHRWRALHYYLYRRGVTSKGSVRPVAGFVAGPPPHGHAARKRDSRLGMAAADRRRRTTAMTGCGRPVTASQYPRVASRNDVTRHATHHRDSPHWTACREADGRPACIGASARPTAEARQQAVLVCTARRLSQSSDASTTPRARLAWGRYEPAAREFRRYPPTFGARLPQDRSAHAACR